MENKRAHLFWLSGLVAVSLLAAAGIWRFASAQQQPPPPTAPRPTDEPPPKPAASDTAKRKEIGKNVFFEVDGDKRRVIVQAYVCLREGQLEQLLTRKAGKEHEAILAADMDARHIHAALLLTGARAGAPVQFDPKYVPASGTRIKVTLQYEDRGKTVSVPAQQWVRAAKSGKDLAIDWVFAGSHFVANPLDPNKPDYYLANDGDVICVANFEGALLDLPIQSTQANADLLFEANTPRIPPRDTKVTIILEPMPDKR